MAVPVAWTARGRLLGNRARGDVAVWEWARVGQLDVLGGLDR